MRMIYNSELNDYICQGEPMEWAVTEVTPKADYTMLLTFANGKRGTFDASHLLSKRIYEPLRRLEFFMQAHVCGDTVAWDEEIDIAPEYLYNNSEL